MISRLVSQAAVIGVAAAIAVAAPAAAATTPTLSGPAQRTGFGTVTLSGTAAPGASVHLYETAIGWNDLQPAEDWERGSGTVTATADSSGRYSIVRYLDSGFYFQTEADGLRSSRITVHMQVLPTFWVRSPSAGVLDAHVSVSPNAGDLTVQFQRQSGSTWSTVATARTSSVGEANHRFTGLANGSYTYRATVLPDPGNGVLGNTSAPHSTHVAGAPGTTPAPTPTTPKPTPTTPKPTPTPTKPAPAPVPAAGSVVFAKIQFDAPGTDNGSNGSLVNEWFALSNRTKATINLNGWTVRDVANHVYKFNGTFNLKPGANIYVRTGKGTNSGTNRYWGRTGYVWNNAGDTAYLRSPSGKSIDTCKWTSRGVGYTTC